MAEIIIAESFGAAEQQRHADLQAIIRSPDMLNMRCPVTHKLFGVPVVASDSNTYEFSAFVNFTNNMQSTHRTFPLDGGLVGNPMPNGTCVLNRDKYETTCAFRIANGLPVVPVPAELLTGPWTPPGMAPVIAMAPAPKAAAFRPRIVSPFPSTSDFYRTLLNVEVVDRPSILDLATIGTFLWEVRHAGLDMIHFLLQGNVNMRLPRTAIILRMTTLTFEAANRDAMYKLFDNIDFLQTVTKEGLDMMNYLLDIRRVNETVADKIVGIRSYLPLKIQMTDEMGTFPMEVKRCWSMERMLAECFHRRCLLHVPGGAAPLGNYGKHFLGTGLRHCGLEHGSTLTISPRVPVPKTIEVGDGFQVLLSFGGNTYTIVAGPMNTVSDMKQIALNLPEIRDSLTNLCPNFHIRFLSLFQSGVILPMLDTDTLGSDGVNLMPNSRIRMLNNSEAMGGMPKKGAKKTIAKPEKIQQLQAMHMYHLTKTPSIALALNHVQAAGFITNQVNGMTEAQCRSLQADCDVLTQVRENTLVETVSPHFFDQIEGWKNEIATLQSRITTAESAIGVAFATEFYDDKGMNYGGFFDLVAERLTTFDQNNHVQAQIQAAQNQMANQMEAEVQRRLAAAAAPDGDAMDL